MFDSNCFLGISYRSMTLFRLIPEFFSGSSSLKNPNQRAQHCQAPNNAIPNEDQIRIQSNTLTCLSVSVSVPAPPLHAPPNQQAPTIVPEEIKGSEGMICHVRVMGQCWTIGVFAIEC